MEDMRPLQSVPDDELLFRLAELLGQSRHVESNLVAHIAEVDERRLYAREASPSMFAYCTDVLHLSEAEAYLRIATARASREHPVLLTMLGDGRLHLTAIAKLAPHLNRGNAEALLARASHKSKRQIEELIAESAPRPDAPSVMRRLPEARGQWATRERQVGTGEIPRPRSGEVIRPESGVRKHAGSGVATLPLELRPDGVSPAVGALRDEAPGQARLPAPSATVEPLAAARYKVQFTARAELHLKLRRLQELMRTTVPNGDLAAIIEEAVTEKIARLEARRFAKTSSPRKRPSTAGGAPSARHVGSLPPSRHLPAAIKRAVSERDGNRCRYTDDRGTRCTERGALEFHHSIPYGYGGGDGPENIRLLCRAHNSYMAEHDYGREAMRRHRQSEASRVPMTSSAGAGRQPPRPKPDAIA